MIRLTRAQVREIDRRATEEYHIPGIVLMENAARAVVDVAWQMLGRRPSPVLIVCGGGNNGGDGLAVARHLHNRRCDVSVFLANDPSKYSGDALINFTIVKAMQLKQGWSEGPALLIDALLGTGLTQTPRSDAIEVIRRINQQNVPVLAVDLPSGLDCDSGEALDDCVRATRTVTFVAEKVGFANPASKEFTGEIIVGDIGCPYELIETVARTSF